MHIQNARHVLHEIFQTTEGSQTFWIKNACITFLLIGELVMFDETDSCYIVNLKTKTICTMGPLGHTFMPHVLLMTEAPSSPSRTLSKTACPTHTRQL